MNLLFHTIALEPARWLPQRVSRPLAELLPVLADAGFDHLEIYEPHLTLAPDEAAHPAQFAANRLTPVILSSYLDIAPSTNPDEAFAAQVDVLFERVERFNFRKVRLFPGRSPSPAQIPETIQAIARRLQTFADRRPDIEFLLETHDGSLADDPGDVVSLVEHAGRPNVALLWQPTVFEPAAARAQFAAQKPYIRHFHLQNRTPAGSMTTLETGVIPWAEFLGAAPADADATLEFIPSAICPVEQFDLAASLAEAAREMQYVRSLTTVS